MVGIFWRILDGRMVECGLALVEIGGFWRKVVVSGWRLPLTFHCSHTDTHEEKTNDSCIYLLIVSPHSMALHTCRSKPTNGSLFHNKIRIYLINNNFYVIVHLLIISHMPNVCMLLYLCPLLLEGESFIRGIGLYSIWNM